MTPSAVTLSLVMAGVALIAISTSAISIGATIHVQRQLAYGQLLYLDRYIEQLPPEQQLPY